MTGLHDGLKTDLANLRIDMNTRFGEVNRRLDKIDATLKTHSEKFAELDERTSPLGQMGRRLHFPAVSNPTERWWALPNGLTV
jgi:hypothetical protein